MPRPATGTVIEHTRKDGLVSFWLRFTAYGERHRLPLGTNEEGWSRARAERELATVLALVRVGQWEPPAPDAGTDDDPTFHVFASEYLNGRRAELASNTYADYRWRLVTHLLPFFAEHRVSAIDERLVDKYRNTKVDESQEIRARQADGIVQRDADGRLIRPLSNESINKTLAMLAMILDVAVDYRLLAENPARGKRRRLKATRPRRPFLEPDELRDLLAAARALDARGSGPSEEAAEVRRLRDDERLSFPEIARRLGISVSTAHYRDARARATYEPDVPLKYTVVAVLAGAGLRVSELCDLRWRDVDLVRGRITIPDAKTPAGIREIRLTAFYAEALARYRQALGAAPGANAFVFATSTGRRRDRKNVCDRIVKRTVRHADDLRERKGLPPLPAGVTPHALRCTFISMQLEAGYPLKYVMDQVGHEDESTTMRIYARVLKRRSRDDLDRRFDELVA